MRGRTKGKIVSVDVVECVALANPVRNAALESPGLGVAFEQLGDRIVANTRPRSGRARPLRRAVVLGLVASVVVASVAVATVLTTYTGIFPSKAGTENDTSELLRTDAPDFPPLVARLVQDIPFPPGDSAISLVPRYVAEQNALQAQSGGAEQTVQAAGIKGTFSHWAVCAWRGYWLYAYGQHDAASLATAADGLSRVAASPAEKATDNFWPYYLTVAQNESAGDPSAPAAMGADWYQVGCAGLPQPWAGK